MEANSLYELRTDSVCKAARGCHFYSPVYRSRSLLFQLRPLTRSVYPRDHGRHRGFVLVRYHRLEQKRVLVRSARSPTIFFSAGLFVETDSCFSVGIRCGDVVERRSSFEISFSVRPPQYCLQSSTVSRSSSVSEISVISSSCSSIFANRTPSQKDDAWSLFALMPNTAC